MSLTVLGEGPDRRKVEALVRERRLDWVSLPGRVPRDELRQLYAAADVYLSPARLESFGIAALEARTVGLPVIGRSGSGVGEFVTDGVNGLVVSSDSQMSSAIARLAKDPGEVARMRAWNITHPPEQEWSHVAALAVAEYERAARAGPPMRTMRTNVPGGLVVVAIDADDRRVVEARLGHGEHPEVVLGAAGWAIESPFFATMRDDGALEVGYRVRELDGIRPRREGAARDAGVGDEEVGEPYQRVAAYAVVTSARGLLLTQFNTQTHVAGDWGLPGGGLDDGETPVDGVHREVWEETGQRVELGGLLTVQSQHWVGRCAVGHARGLPRGAHRLCRDVSRARATSSSTTSAARRPTPAGCR